MQAAESPAPSMQQERLWPFGYQNYSGEFILVTEFEAALETL